MDISEILDRLECVRRTGPDKYQSRCPAHHDTDPSFSIEVSGDKILLHCFAGCSKAEVVDSLGIRMRDLFKDDLSHENISHAHKFPQKDDDFYHSKIVLELARSDRLNGKKLSKNDIDTEETAYLKLKKSRN